MHTLQFAPITADKDLQQILDLQAINLASNISPQQALEQGFLTVEHDFATLKRMNNTEQGILARAGDILAGYILAMSRACRDYVPILVPMFETFDRLTFKGKHLNGYSYIVVGQICVAEAYRGRGTFDRMYDAYRTLLASKYDLTVTEISQRNHRSLRAHQRVGFQVISEFVAPDGEVWDIVVWDWRS